MLLCDLTPAHIEVAATLHQTSFDHAWTQKEFQGLLALPTTKGWISDDGLLLVSHVLDEIEILTILIHPNERRKGKAAFFLNHLIEYAKKNDVSCIFLEVNVNNFSAIKLYEKIGFVKTGVRKNYYKMNDGTFNDALLYRFSFNEMG